MWHIFFLELIVLEAILLLKKIKYQHSNKNVTSAKPDFIAATLIYSRDSK